jgi:hypothetical protein
MPDPSPPPAAVRSPRDPRLDVFRGLALVMIFVNHVPGTIYERLTNRNFGMSDAAEGFVLMSGVAAGIAYSPAFRTSPFWPGVARVWHRAWTLYLVHIMMTSAALAIAAAAALWFGATTRLYVNEMNVFFEKPLAVLVGLPLLTHQFGYTNILPMYAALLVATPALLWLAWRQPVLLMAGSALLWLATGLREWNLPNFPNPGGWFFNPFAWQAIFVVGLMIGVRMRQGRRLVPVRRSFQWVAGGVLLLALVWVRIPSVAEVLNHGMWMMNQAGADRFFTITDKTYVTWPRLIHILALAYLLSSLNWVRTAAQSPAAAPLAILGRNALPVFALGTLLALSAQAVKDVAPTGLAVDTALILGGLGVQLGFAWLKDRLSLKRGTVTPAAVRTASVAT